VSDNAQQSMAHLTGTTRSIYAPSFDSVEILPDADLPRLTHLGKDRPRLRKANFVKRPVVACEMLLVDDDDTTFDRMGPSYVRFTLLLLHSTNFNFFFKFANIYKIEALNEFFCTSEF